MSPADGIVRRMLGRLRNSLRYRVLAMTLLVSLTPQVLVVAWSQLSGATAPRLWYGVRDAVDEAEAGEGKPLLTRAELEERLREVAQRRGVWMRAFMDHETGGPFVDVSADAPYEPMTRLTDRVERFLLGRRNPPSLRKIDAARAPMRDRKEVAVAFRLGTYIDCDLGEAVWCEAVRPVLLKDEGVAIVVAMQGSNRDVGAVYGLRHVLLRLALLTVPLSLLLAWLTARRVVRPIQEVKQRALALSREQTNARTPETYDEARDLAAAIESLLAELSAREHVHAAFVDDLVHELKSPVASLRAAADALSSPPAGAAIDEAASRTQRLARSIEGSSRRLEGIVGRFLDLSRAKAGFPDEEREPVDLAVLLRETAAEVESDARFPQVAFEVALGEGDLSLRGIPARLAAMMRELLDNGASFVEGEGRVRARLERYDEGLRLTVTDDGPGIPEAQRARIFDRYYTTRAEARGTGLGLALVRAVAEAHGGTARAETPAAGARGATFVVELPGIA
ncbi:MAG: HAMP domain-containing histidine kinase [Polyangiaceae bacterium]|nr:HAMP domain-containing histidine kinase [Polyangiaceae bacterium]